MSILLATLGLLIGLGLVFALLTTAFYLYETANSPPPSFAPDERGPSAGTVAAGLATAFAAHVAISVIYPLGLSRAPRRLLGRNGNAGPQVICIHGLYHNASAWLPAKRLLRRSGLGPVTLLSYSSFGTGFEALADRLAGEVEALLDQNGPAVLLGHSLGGLFIRALVARPDIGPRVKAAATLGTPHQGSKLAALAVGGLGRSIIYQSPLIERLAALPEPEGLPRLCLVSPADDMVMPLSALEPVRPGWKVVVTAPVSHVFMLCHPPTLRLAIDFLSQASRDGS